VAAYKEIVTKAVVGKGKKRFKNSYTVEADNTPTTILGCWVINHGFKGYKAGDKVGVNGSFDINIWYSYDNDTKTDVIRQTDNYNEIVTIKNNRDVVNEEIIVRSLKQPSCVKVDIEGNDIVYTIEKELGIELVGDEKVKIETSEEEDPWDEILDEGENAQRNVEGFEENLDSINENFIDEATI